MVASAEAVAARPAFRWGFPDLSRALEAEQDRWFLWLPVLYGVGIALYFALLREPPLALALALVPVALALRLVATRGTLAVVVAAALLAIVAGFAAAKLRTHVVTAPVLERQLGPVMVRGFVEQVEPRATRGQRLTIRVTSIERLAAQRTPVRVRIRTLATAGLRPGDAVRVRATLAPPGIPTQPGDYDFARAAFFKSIGGVGYSLRAAERDPDAGLPPLGLRIGASIAAVRQAIGERVAAGLHGERGAIASALITGERGGISEVTNTAYRDSGLFHILSISGLHMSIMAGAVFFSVRAVLAAVPLLALGAEIKKWSAAAAILAAFAYLLISGAEFATVRSWVMITIMFLAVLLDRPAIAMRNVALGALAILVALPESLLDVGFQMSFAAVLALVAAYEAIRERLAERRVQGLGRTGWVGIAAFLGGIVLTTLIASIAVAPFAAFHFHKSQQYAIIANLIAIPVCNAIVMPAALATLVLMPFGLEPLPLWIMGLGIDAMNWCAFTVARLPGAITPLPAISMLSFGLMVAGGLWLCLWRRRWRLLGLAVAGLGVAVAPLVERADILVGNEGRAFAARTDGRSLAAPPGRGASFELGRWLESDGDRRSIRDVQTGRGIRCDGAGCTARVKDMTVALVRHPSAVAEDCLKADLVITTFPRPRFCRPRVALIDLYDLRDRGTHAVFIGETGARIVTVAAARGARPWSQRNRGDQPATVLDRDPDGSRLPAFASPIDLGGDDDLPRPDVDEDDWDRQ